MAHDREQEICDRCGSTLNNHIGNTGCIYPCWTPSGRFALPTPAPEPFAPPVAAVAPVDERLRAINRLRELEANAVLLSALLIEVRAENIALRKLLWLRHHPTTAGLYGDDGEMQCGACRIDFKRNSVESIEGRLIESNASAFAAAQAAFVTREVR